MRNAAGKIYGFVTIVTLLALIVFGIVVDDLRESDLLYASILVACCLLLLVALKVSFTLTNWVGKLAAMSCFLLAPAWLLLTLAALNGFKLH